MTKQAYNDYLNEIGGTLSFDSFVIGDKLRGSKYKDMLRKHDPIAFQVGYNE